MFDIGFTELLLIAVLGLVIIGPKRLPEVVRTISLWIGRIRRSFSGLKQEVEREFKLDDVRLQLYNEEVMNRLKESRQQVEEFANESKAELNKQLSEPASGPSVQEPAEPTEPAEPAEPAENKTTDSSADPSTEPSEPASDSTSDTSPDHTLDETRNKQ